MNSEETYLERIVNDNIGRVTSGRRRLQIMCTPKDRTKAYSSNITKPKKHKK